MLLGRFGVISSLMAAHLVWTAAARAQLIPLEPEFQVNTYTTSFQSAAAVASDSAGNFVVVWTSSQGSGSDTSLHSVEARRFDVLGAPQGAQFQVNTYTTDRQEHPAVAVDADGDFMVVWTSDGSAGSDTDMGSIQGRRYDASGVPLGPEFQVNTHTTGNQQRPAVTVDGGGTLVVVWEGNGIRAQRFDAAGTTLGGEVEVSGPGLALEPAVAADDAGNFLVAWGRLACPGDTLFSFCVEARRYDTTGTDQGPPFQVNTDTTLDQRDPAVAADGDGNFVVAWEDGADVFSGQPGLSIRGQRYDAGGAPIGGEFQANTYTTGMKRFPAVAADDGGEFVVAWTSFGSAGADGDGYSVHARHYDGAGVAQGTELELNSYTTNDQQAAAVTRDGTGRFVIAWSSYGGTGSDTDRSSIQVRRLALPTATSITVATTTSSTSLPTTTSSTVSSTTSTIPTMHRLPGRTVVVRPGTLAKVLARPSTGDVFALPTADPIAVGGTLRIFDTGGAAGDDTYLLPAGATQWRGLGSPAGTRGYLYRGAGTPADPCRIVLLKERVVRAVCTGAGISLAPPFSGEVRISLRIGTTERYCASFGGDEARNDETLTKRRHATPPFSCP